MKPTLSIVFFLKVNLVNCQTSNYENKIVKEFTQMSILEAPFMVNEIIEIYKEDTLFVKKAFKHSIFDRTEYTLYCYNVCSAFFHNTLLEKKNDRNKEVIEKIISELDYDKNIIKPQISWARIFETCQSCPFGEYPDEMMFYFKFSILFMGEEEIKSMVQDEDRRQWKYVLEDIKYGDAFTLYKEGNYKQYVIDRRMANYIIDKWKLSEAKEVQKLITVYKSLI